MITASTTPSLARRIRTFALAGTLATGMLFPMFQSARADTEPTAETASASEASGFSISVESVDQLTGLTAVVATGGENVHLRSEASSDADSLGKIPDGSVVALRVDVVDTVYDASGNRWWPVTFDGTDGWVTGEFLTNATTAEGDVVSSNLAPFEYAGEASANSTGLVFGNGENVNVREEPSSTSEIVTKAPDGSVISLRIDMVDTVYDDQGTRWWPVTVNGIEGWVSGFHLADSNDAATSSSTSAEASATEEAASESNGTFAAGDSVQVFTGDGDSINARESGSPEAPVIGQFADGEVIRIVSGPSTFDSSESGWYEATNGSVTGFVDGDLLVASAEEETSTSESPTASATEPPASEEEEATAAATEAPESTEATVTPAATQETAPPQSSSTFTYPLAKYTRTQGFGCSNLGFYSYNATYGCAVHNGLDLAAPAGSSIMAAGSGTVVTAGWCNCGLGYYVEIDHGNGVHTLYGHMASQPYVSAGQTVSQGESIGPVGSTGISTGPHVHFMVTVNGTAKNPENYLP